MQLWPVRLARSAPTPLPFLCLCLCPERGWSYQSHLARKASVFLLLSLDAGPQLGPRNPQPQALCPDSLTAALDTPTHREKAGHRPGGWAVPPGHSPPLGLNTAQRVSGWPCVRFNLLKAKAETSILSCYLLGCTLTRSLDL